MTNNFHYRSDGKKPSGAIEKTYIESGDWKCPKSPTGGHWWDCNVRPSICKYCGKSKVHEH